MANYNLNHKFVLDDLLLSIPLVRAGKMFGYPAYYAGQKLAICLYEEGVGLKIAETTARRLLEGDGCVSPFQPLGRPPMREWIQITQLDSEGYRAYLPVFEESIQFVLDQQSG